MLHGRGAPGFAEGSSLENSMRTSSTKRLLRRKQLMKCDPINNPISYCKQVPQNEWYFKKTLKHIGDSRDCVVYYL